MPNRSTFSRLWSATRETLSHSGEWIDAAAYAVSPSWGTRRKAMRRLNELHARQTEVMGQHWEGSDTTDRLRGDRWLASRLSPDSALELGLADLRRNAQELYRTFGYCHGAIEGRVGNVIGTGIRAQARIKAVPGWISDTEAEQFNAELEALYERWAPMAGRRMTMCEIERQVERNFLRDGEAFVVISDVGRADKPIPLELTVIAAERVETPPEQEGNPRVRLGIEKDARGNIVAYYVRNSHPDDVKNLRIDYERIPADRMLHIFDPEFPDQSRGLPWFSAVVPDSKDFKDFKEATIIAAQVAACVTMIVSSSNPTAMSNASQNSDGEFDMRPGKILFRNNADQVHTLNPNQPGTTYGMFAEWNLLGIAGGLNWPFGWLCKDRRRSTFSSGKLEEIDGGVVCKTDQQRLKDYLLMPIWRRFVTEAVILGEVSISPTKYNRRPWLFQRVAHIAPGRPWIDPPKEVGAAIDAKNENLMSLADIHAKLGMDTEETLLRREYERRLEEKLGIVPPAVQSATAAAESAEQEDVEETEEELQEA